MRFYYDSGVPKPVRPVASSSGQDTVSNTHFIVSDNTMITVPEACVTLTAKNATPYYHFTANSASCTPYNTVDDKAHVFCMTDPSMTPQTTTPSTTTVTTPTTTTQATTTTTTKPEPIPGDSLPKMPCISAAGRKKRATGKFNSFMFNIQRVEYLFYIRYILLIQQHICKPLTFFVISS